MGEVRKPKLLSKIHCGSKAKISLLLHPSHLAVFLVTCQYDATVL